MLAVPTFSIALLALIIAFIPSPYLAFHTPPTRPLRSSCPLPATNTNTEAATSPLICPDETSPAKAHRLLLERVDQIISYPFSINGDASSPSLHPAQILGNIDKDHERDVRWAQVSALPFETEIDANNNGVGERFNSIGYESISATQNHEKIAIRTNLPTPLLASDEIQLLRRACESYWNRPDDGELEKSRFTYQRKGNSEAHLSDVVRYSQQSSSNDVSGLVNRLLLNRIYPWIREAYLSTEENGNDLELYVYDSIFIRYNATEANESNPLLNQNGQQNVGAGQPLHRDLGYVSVNIMLSPQEEFQGGGTFFENQLLPMVISDNEIGGLEFNSKYESEMQSRPLKPLGPGGALAHFSSNRHAGAATYEGVRDILVMFLAATEKKPQHVDTNMVPRKAPRWEYNARIKSTARTSCSECYSNIEDQLICRILHHRIAIDQVHNDGEAWHYLGMALLDYHGQSIANGNSGSHDVRNTLIQGEHTLELAISCLDVATKHTPCDARLYNNLGIALERLLEYHNTNSMQDKATELHQRIKSAYQRSVMIHSTCEQVGCDVGADYESACLNYGLYLSKLDAFYAAAEVLSRVASRADAIAVENEMDAATWARQRVITDAKNLLDFCMRQRDQ